MKIQTFKKISQNLLDLLLLPVSLFVLLALYFWQTGWEEHFFLVAVAFMGAASTTLYFAAINLIDKPYLFLKTLYENNKKYKKLHRLQIEKIEDEQGPQVRFVQRTQQQETTKQTHIKFKIQASSQPILESLSLSPLRPSVQPKLHQQPLRQITKSFHLHHQQQTPPQVPANDISNLFFYTRSDQNQPTRKFTSHRQQSTQVDEQQFRFEQQTNEVQRIMGGYVNKETFEDQLREEADKRYNEYKRTLERFGLDKGGMDIMVQETKNVVKEQIDQHLKLQYANLQQLQSLFSANYQLPFFSFSQKLPNTLTPNSFNAQFHSSESNLPQPKARFSQLLLQGMNLVNIGHWGYDTFWKGPNPQTMRQVKSKIAALIKQRIKLDSYLNLAHPLTYTNVTTAVQSSNINKQQQYQQRYLHLLKLERLSQILSQRPSAQQNLLKEYFSRPTISDKIQHVNSAKNVQLLVDFMVNTFTKRLTQCDNEDWIRIQTKRPDFKDERFKGSSIWLKRQASFRSHYNIVYSVPQQQPNPQKAQLPKEGVNPHKQNKLKPQTEIVHCCPGDSNIWTTLTLVRQLISKIGLKKNQFPMISDKRLRKDFLRLYELLK